MEMKRNKKQTKSLYITLLLIIVCVAGVVAFSTALAEDREEISKISADKKESGFDVVKKPEIPTSDKSAEDTDKDEKESGKSEEKASKTDEIGDVVDAGALAEDTNEDAAADASAVQTEENTESVSPVFISPVSGIVITSFSDTVPVFSETMNDYRTHVGVDVSGTEGEAVLAAADGVIGAVWDDPLMGTCMTVVHDGGTVTTYKGLNSTIPDGIAQGVEVKCGQPIAALGDTALIEVAEEPHVHFEMTVGGVPVDPTQYVTFGAAENYEE